MQKIAILGANGFLGSPIADAFSTIGWEVVSLSRSANEKSAREEYAVNLFDEESLRSAITFSKPDAVLSTAWDTEHGKFWTNKSNIDYRDATLKFAEICFEAGVKNFMGLGTMSEYGTSPGFCNAKVSPLVENDIYSKSKIETGIELKNLAKDLDAKLIGRVFQAFGPREKSERYVPGLITNLKKGTNSQFVLQTLKWTGYILQM